ncbi:MAG: DUF4423 domain-containing protein [Bdellovibrionales bacterium]|nr:DUF4423 domain-containing protein [Bdellovibrionales bacterium]
MSENSEKFKYHDVGAYLSQFFEKRRGKNPRYSIRAFARDVGISSGRASELLRGISLPGRILRKRIAEELKLNKNQKNQLNLLAESHVSLRKKSRIKTGYQLNDKEFTLLPEWQHFAVLNILNTTDVQPNTGWIANRLALSEETVQDSLQKLVRARLIEEKDGFYKTVHQHLTSTSTIPSAALRSYNRQMIERALWSLDNVPLELRNVTSIMMTANPDNLYKLKVLTNEFKQRAAQLFGEGEATEVYSLCVQIFPCTAVESPKE